MDLMVKNTDGKPDAILTMTVITLTIILLKFAVSGVTFAVDGSHSINFGAVDSGVIASLLGPTLGAYVARRYTEKKFAVDLNNNGKIDPEEEVK